MSEKTKNHPCFDPVAAKSSARLHLPLIRSCNLSCGYCNRKYNCPNENRPGVTSGIISPESVEKYVNTVLEKFPSLSVIGVAGPGEVFAEPDILQKALSVVRDKFPHLSLCISTNGYALLENIDLIKELKIDFVTVTVNSLNPETVAKIYKNVDPDVLIRKQRMALDALVGLDIVVKINTVVVPDVNFDDVVDVAKLAGEMGLFAQNLMPFYPVEGSEFENLREPSEEEMNKLRLACSRHIKQISHCKRCRADACGYL